MKFQLHTTDTGSRARAGTLTTGRGEIPTPIFMPVGTVASVKTIDQRQLKNELGAKIILGNTYHLYLRPGTDVLQAAGGLPKFMHWDGPMLTDSGGYQVFSLASQRKLSEDGVWFKSHIDGSTHLFTPESVIETERAIGADIIMVLDECAPYPCDERYARESMEMTHRWLIRCREHFNRTQPLYGVEQTLFPIVQGSMYPELRRISAETIAAQDFEGNAIGGLSVGEPAEIMYELTDLVCGILPAHKPRYLMGVGTPANILECIALGVDMFDCIMPTRNARHGMIFTRHGIRNMRNEKYEKDFSPLDPDSELESDHYYTKSYIRHLLRANEYLAMQITSQHNIWFYLWLVREARKHILAGDFASWKTEMVKAVSTRL